VTAVSAVAGLPSCKANSRRCTPVGRRGITRVDWIVSHTCRGVAVPSLVVATGDLRATYAAIIAAVGGGDDAAFDRLLVKDFVDHNPVPGQPPGRAGFAYWAGSARAAFADLHGTVEDSLVDGYKLAGRTTWRGTHTGSFLGVPATGRGIQFAAYHIVRFADGLAAEWWGTGDLLTALSQLGATIRPPE
jgi:predicted ester cyclase